MISDPAGQFRFALPLGWSADATRSSLTTLAFIHWERSGERLSVRALPSLVPGDAPDAAWHGALAQHPALADARPVTPFRAGPRAAVQGERTAAGTGPEQRRWVLVRGRRLDVHAEHTGRDALAEPFLSEPLQAFCASLDIPTDTLEPGPSQPEQVYGLLQQAQDAGARGDWNGCRDRALEALRLARATYLARLIQRAPLPEVPAALAMVDALFISAVAGDTLAVLRDAEHFALRVRTTLQRLSPGPAPRQRIMALTQEIDQRLDALCAQQYAIAKADPNAVAAVSPGLGTALLRAEAFLERSRRASENDDLQGAGRAAENALGELFFALAAFNGRGQIPAEALGPELRAKLEAAGAGTPETQAALAGQIVLRMHMLSLQEALLRALMFRHRRGDLAEAHEAGHLLLAVSRRLNRPEKTPAGGEFLPPEGQPRSQAHTLLQIAHTLSDVGDAPSLEQAEATLDEADALLDHLAEEGALRAAVCLQRANLLHLRQQTSGALEVIERGLRAAHKDPKAMDGIVLSLKSVQSQFLLNLERFEEARAAARSVVRMAEGEGPEARYARASQYLNLAVVEHQVGEREPAEAHLFAALRRVMEVDPLDELTMRALMVASATLQEGDPSLARRLNLAAAATLDARRARIGSDALRISFDETPLRREVYGSLISNLLAARLYDEAVAATERSRARALAELLARPDAGPPAIRLEARPPPLRGKSRRRGFAEIADYLIRLADSVYRQQGAAPLLSAGEIMPFVAELGAPVLVVQPVRQEVVLFLLHPSGKARALASPMPLAAMQACIAQLQDAFAIFSVPRGSPAAGTEPPEPKEAAPFQQTLRMLGEVLVAPVASLLTEGEPLIIAPYREFLLLPFALLQAEDGRPLIERHPLTVVPSLAILRALRQRGPWTLLRPEQAYVAGDPATDPKFLMPRLPAARRDAEQVAALLEAAGVPPQRIVLRLEEAAHEESYRHEARRADLVHLACHAELAEPAFESCLYFAPQPAADSRVTAAEVAKTPLNDALVFLAACETGQGRATADGVVGLGRAFLEAGARAVVLSLWRVEDAATAAMSAAFYRELLDPERPATAAEALRRAMLKTRQALRAGEIMLETGQALPEHPAYWAPFLILGDGLSIRYGRN